MFCGLLGGCGTESSYGLSRGGCGTESSYGLSRGGCGTESSPAYYDLFLNINIPYLFEPT
jgi:hypothetical protein